MTPVHDKRTLCFQKGVTIHLLQVIDFGDNIDFTPISGTEQDELSCNWDDIPLDSSNLVIKVQPFILQLALAPKPLCYLHSCPSPASLLMPIPGNHHFLSAVL